MSKLYLPGSEGRCVCCLQRTLDWTVMGFATDLLLTRLLVRMAAEDGVRIICPSLLLGFAGG